MYYLAIVLIVSVVVTSLAFLLLRALKIEPVTRKRLSAAALPALLMGTAAYVVICNPDPHGLVMVGLSFVTLLSLPVTILTATLLARRFQ
jgi:hypothetical protein